ncbi:MAG: carboxy-terminal peptidase [Bacteroidota bacterium]|jgi:carboxyl-terminal processing protease
MRNLLIIVAAACIVQTPAAHAREDDSTLIRISKAIETFGFVFREINSRYVDDVDPKELIDVGVAAMLDHLDPYSEYFEHDETDEVESITTGSYVGFGISVTSIDSILTITDVREAGPARLAGIRIGDQLLAIDSTRTDTMASDQLRTYTRGPVGSRARLRLMREGRSDTIDLLVSRNELELESIGVTDILPGEIGYINLVRFSRNTAAELKQAIARLRTRSPLKGLIVDVRDNPGGLLEAAINVVELFVPRGSRIVSTRGRYEESQSDYVSETDPIEPTVPLAVLINERSASASEIVAGALQDLDRAVIVGRRSFGKGLVQSIIPLDNEALLKLTTARYYTPSGRCIQQIDYRGEPARRDTAVYRTAAGRTVAATHGIDPDSTVSDSLFAPVVQFLWNQNLIQRFATRATSSMTALPAGFSASNETVDAFLKFIAQQPLPKRSRILASLSASIDQARNDKWPAGTVAALESAIRVAERDVNIALRREQKELVELITIEMRARFGTSKDRDALLLARTPAIRAAAEILRTQRYQQFLSGELPSNH